MKPLALLLSLVLAAPTFAGTITVGPPGSGAMFPDIQPAITAAQPGDQITVAGGTYSPFVLDKEVDIIGLPGALPIVDSPLSGVAAIAIRQIHAGSQVIVAGLTATAPPTSCLIPNWWPDHGCEALVDLRFCQGTVTLQDVTADQMIARSSPTLGVDHCAQVFVHDSTFVGGGVFAVSQYSNATPSAGVYANQSTVELSNCSVQGGDGKYCCTSNTGAPGIRGDDSTITLSDVTVVGGLGGVSDFPIKSAANMGASGIYLDASDLTIHGPHSKVRGGDSQHIGYYIPCAKGGTGIEATNGSHAVVPTNLDLAGGIAEAPCDSSYTGLDFKHINGSSFLYSFLVFPTIHPVPGVVAPGATVTFNLEGVPSARVSVYSSTSLSSAFALPGMGGFIFLDLFNGFLPLGEKTLDTQGHESLSLSVPTSPSLVGATVHTQGIQTGLGVGVRLSNVAVVLIQ